MLPASVGVEPKTSWSPVGHTSKLATEADNRIKCQAYFLYLRLEADNPHEMSTLICSIKTKIIYIYKKKKNNKRTCTAVVIGTLIHLCQVDSSTTTLWTTGSLFPTAGCLFDLGLMSLSTIFQSYRDGIPGCQVSFITSMFYRNSCI